MSDADDRWEILQLMHRYSHAVDSGDFDAFADLFSKGAFTIASAGATLRGREEVKHHAVASVFLYDGSPRTNHFLENPVIEIAADGLTARATSYVQVLQEVLPDFPLQTIATARYRDTFARDEDGWHFTERVAEPVFRGDLSHHTRAAGEPSPGGP
jgi:hypothetical protein